ncbi:MAG: hypothetical protein K8W52_19050 [Deltaproteobacteria bacterium]|nr:hypothetical protein [Deltaproteobacteria bacterium]
MGFLNFITGGGAKVQITLPTVAFPSLPIAVKIHVTAADAFACTNVFIDVSASEHVQIRPHGAPADVTETTSTFSTSVAVAPGFALAKGETKELVGIVTLPPGSQPSYHGKHARHVWTIQARLEAKGNDPDSGWKEIRIGANM